MAGELMERVELETLVARLEKVADRLEGVLPKRATRIEEADVRTMADLLRGRVGVAHPLHVAEAVVDVEEEEEEQG